MIVRFLLAAASIAAAPLSAMAQSCPTGADLETGITLTRSDPFLSLQYQQTSDGLAEARVMTPGGAPEDMDTLYAHPLIVKSRILDTGLLVVTTDNDIAGLDNLFEARTWTSPVSLAINDSTFTQGTYTVDLTGLGQASIGGCDYDVWRLRDIMTLDNGAIISFEKSYAPDLGLVIGSIQFDADGRPTGDVFFDEITAD